MYSERASRRSCLERLAGDATLRAALEATLTPLQVAGNFNRVPTYELETFLRNYDSSPDTETIVAVEIDVQGFQEP